MAGCRGKLNDDFQKKFCSAIASGLSKKSACYATGITQPTLYSWINLGDEGIEQGKNNKYVKFVQELHKAEAAFKMNRLKNIKRAGDSGNWQADAWMLERCFPDEFGRRNAVEVSGPDKQAIEVDQSGSIEIIKVRLPDNGRNDSG